MLWEHRKVYMVAPYLSDGIMIMPSQVLLQQLSGLHLQLPLVVQWLLPPIQMHMQWGHLDC